MVHDERTDAELAERVAHVVDRHARHRVGLAVGVGRGDATIFLGRGRIGASRPETPGPDTIFEIGSVTKVFTATLLAVLVEDGSVELDQPVTELLPEHIQIPVRQRSVTLFDLATHTSGLPRLPRGWMWRSLLRDRDNPYALFTAADLDRAIVDGTLRRAPGRAVRYSNFGVGLLGHALAVHAGRTYEEMVRERICAPLGLADTAITVPDADRDRFADGHNRAGRPVPHWDLALLAGAGALRSTVTDLMAFLAAQYTEDGSTLARAIRRTQHPHFHRAALGQCLGWMSLAIRRGSDTQVLWHNGGTGGFRSFAACIPEQRLRIVVLGNTARSVDRIGQEILRATR